MTFLKILLVIVVVCFLIGCIRFGGTVLYDSDGLTVWAKVLCFRFKVYPPKVLTASEKAAAEEKKRRKAEADKLKKQEQAEKAAAKAAKTREKRIEQEKKRLDKLVQRGELTREDADRELEAFLEKLDAPPPPPKKKGGNLDLLLKLIPVGLKALGELKNALRFDELLVEYTIPGKNDPCGAALQYGAIAAGSGPVAALLDSQLNIRRRRVSAWVDFFSAEALVWARLTITLSVGDVLLLAIRAAYRALRVYLKRREKLKAKAEKKANQTEKAAKPQKQV